MFIALLKTVLAVTLVSVFICQTISALPASQIRHCKDIQRRGNTTNGIYTIFPYKCCPYFPLQVYCDMETDGGGWTVIQRRADIEPREDFFRTWMEYALGFGNLSGEFWLGNDHIHALTSYSLNELRVDLADFEQNHRYAKYSFFYVHDRSSSYKLEVLGYEGDAGDSLSYHNGMKFSTKDNENDLYEEGNMHMENSCANYYKGSWWYNSCYEANLNGVYLSGNHNKEEGGINWEDWLGSQYSLRQVEMKTRPAYK